MQWLIRCGVFLLLIFISTRSYAQQNSTSSGGQQTARPSKQAGTQVVKSAIDSTAIKQTQSDVKRLPTKTKETVGQIANDKKSQVKNSATAAAKSTLMKVAADTAVISNVGNEGKQVQGDLKNYKSTLKAPKFSDIKVDTGEIVLNREGLMQRGGGFLKSNTKDYGLPNLPKRSLNVSPDYKIDQSQSIDDLKNLDTDNLGKQTVGSLSSSVSNSSNGTVSKISNLTDSVSGLANQDILGAGKLQLGNAKTIYSEKFLKKMRDSLGLEKADSVYRIAAPLLKKNVSERELVDALNSSIVDKSPVDDANAVNDSLTSLNGNTLTDQLKATDLANVKLPDSVVNELKPLRGKVIGNKYLNAVDSLRNQNLRADKLKMEEQKLSENIKSAALKKKPNFYDRSYIEGIVGYLETGQFTLLQASPSYAYHIIPKLSLGVGPNVLVLIDDKDDVDVKLGLRAYTKLELYKRRIYLQIEDNMNPTFRTSETVQLNKHTLLGGGGVVLPISKKLALNFSAFYKINQNDSNGSPWVVRLGLSSFKIK